MKQVDLLMIGAGPSNLALAVAIEECEKDALNKQEILILENNSSVSWHKGMLFPNSLSQVSFLKDLVTQRNPTSKFTFLNYLFQINKLDCFINLQTLTPYRIEMSNYLNWVARNLTKTQISYNTKVKSIIPILSGNKKISMWKVISESGEEFLSKKIIYGAGRDINIPNNFKEIKNPRIIHSSNFLNEINKFDINKIAIIGGAQSSAEIYQYCIENYPNSSISLLMRSIGLVNYEGSQFTNELFQNSYINKFFNYDKETRQKILNMMHTTNYSGVAPHTLNNLYRIHYLQNLHNEERFKIYTQCEITHVKDNKDKIEITWHDHNIKKEKSEEFDILLLGTGYKNSTPQIFENLISIFQLDTLIVDRNYKAILPYEKGTSLHLQGVNEITHGIADSLLSVLACRSQEILDDIIRGE